MDDTSAIETQWERLLESSDPVVRSTAEVAARYPSLRRMFPFSSHQDLRFSCATKYPYNWDLPFVRRYEDYFQAVGTNGSILLEGELEEVVARVAFEMGEVLR